jgi:carboxypeptidase Taq
MDFTTTLERLHQLDREHNHLGKVAAVLQWDQETYLPPQGVADRAEQLAILEGIAHERLTNPEIGRLLERVGSDSQNPRGDEKLPPRERDFCKVLRRSYDRAVKLPQDLVSAEARAGGLAQAAWVAARKDNDFAAFAPHLKTMLEFARKKAAYWGFGDKGGGETIYDGLLDAHEPGMTAPDIAAVFEPLRDQLGALLKRIAAAGPQGDALFLTREFNPGDQASYNRELMQNLGFDLGRGRLDISAHPFTSSLGFDDIRITTRYSKNNVLSGIFSTIHESGHAFYEMGLSPELRGGCLAEGVSMGIHESQSRLWENVIGRSRGFWEGQYPGFKARFPKQLEGIDTDAFYRAVNQVRPSLIRVDADEVSYGLHIILRFELEKKLFAGDLAVEDLPGAWREFMKNLLGLEPETDAQGVLQDVHWSMGAFGYFPSYALGNLYALHFWKKLRQDLPDIEKAIARGDFRDLHVWLEEKIYAWGHRPDPAELLMKITGERLSVIPFLEYIESKYTELYGL